MENKGRDEIDLGYVLAKIGQGYNNFLIRIYRGINFLIRNWIILLAIIIGGTILGYFLNKVKTNPKETTIIVEINLGAANYVYDAINQLNNKVKENDTVKLKELGFYNKNGRSLSSIEIEPLTSIMDIAKNAPPNDKNIEILLKQYNGETDALSSDLFLNEYKEHRISLSTPSYADDSIVEDIVNYVNNNETLNKVKQITIENAIRKIEILNESRVFLDSILVVYGSNNTMDQKGSQIYLNTSDADNSDLFQLFETRRGIENEIGFQKLNLLKYDGIMHVLNKPMLQAKTSIFDNKARTIPIALILVFLFLSTLKRFYLKAKKLNNEREQLP